MFSAYQIVNFYNKEGECISSDTISLKELVDYVVNIYRDHPELDHITLVSGSKNVLEGIERKLKRNEELNVPIELCIR
jgi:hypothetical protein